ncbi:MAG: hybrid sensor histidine kinase/response regulator [Leptospiraceae bacterium]|nr:hybrid sensor histidine kinase/response regulator [Leptospiraceae bacterium]
MNHFIKNSKILIVDDNPINLGLLGKALSVEGYKIIFAENGIQAIKSCEKVLPDLILLDIMMPEMDGFETCQHLKSSEKTSDIPILFLTAKVEPKDIVKGFQIGAVDYITKPFNTTELLQRVKTHLSLKHAMEELKEKISLMEDVERITRHDLKNPLNAIINFPDMVRLFGTVNEKQEKFLHNIKLAGLQMLNMINRSLDMVKMERGTYILSPIRLDIIKIIQNIIKDSSRILEAKSLHTKIFLHGEEINPGDFFYLLGEELLCYSMLSNLFQNAIEASPENARIDFSISREEKFAIISLHNSGAVPEEIRENFFEKYITFGKGNQGTGLGTYSARLIAEVQKGSISMTSGEEETTIIITLPIS